MTFLTDQPIDPAPLLESIRRPGDGGLALFVGVVRDQNEGRAVSRLDYEAYGEMAEKEMARIAEELSALHPEARLAMRHRIGSLNVGEVAVVVVAAAPHRHEAFAACQDGIDRIKARVPIWKREHGPSGVHWVEGCSAGDFHETD
ncbi:MAG TPA: molybdenum cofactor biosynthesis protein MoaE [Thermoanaerobaculia bacterium]|nr:molybdenum cofactor biosynthesis protein MoaE [Thermoanaerobaculia bacterium]